MTVLHPSAPAAAPACEIECPHTHTPEDAAVLIGGTTARTLRDRAGRREIPSTKVGREVRFTDADIAQIIAAGSRRPAPLRRDSRRRS